MTPPRSAPSPGPLFDAARTRKDGREQHVHTVAELTRAIKENLEQAFGHVWLVGEISNVRTPSSGHVYMTLKDESAQIAAVVFRNVAQYVRFRLVDGLEVVVFGRITVYGPRGNYQIIAEKIEPKGEGALQLAFKQLKAKLEREGLFDPSRKKPLPVLPTRIGIVTSPTGAAIRDMLDVILRRFPPVQVFVRPVKVQGEGAAEEIAKAIGDFNAWGQVDVLIVGRGGGSLEDLWAFNEETVARAICASRIPVISAVGHEIDVTISDLVADRRALTPTAAGEIVVPEQQVQQDSLRILRGRLAQALVARLGLASQRLDALSRSPAMTRPLDPVRQRQQRGDDLSQRASAAMLNALALANQRASSTGARLESLSPLAVLARGYSLTTRADGRMIGDALSVRPSDHIVTVLRSGRLASVVTEVHEHDPAAGLDAGAHGTRGRGA